MDFSNAVAELDHYKRLRAERTRPLGNGVIHPDRCPKLHIRDVAWAIPPRASQVTPQFSVAGVSVETKAATDWPEVTAFVQAIRMDEGQTCPTCGQHTGDGWTADEDFLSAAFALVGRALRTQYDLSDEDLTDLLAFDCVTMPDWVEPLMRWSVGMPLENAWAASLKLNEIDEAVKPKRKRRRRRRKREAS